MGEQVRLEIGTIVLDWSSWIPWYEVAVDNRGRTRRLHSEPQAGSLRSQVLGQR